MPNSLLYKQITAAALQHGNESDPDHEVGDLQDALSVVIDMLTPAQLKLAAEKIADNNSHFDMECWQEGMAKLQQDAIESFEDYMLWISCVFLEFQWLNHNGSSYENVEKVRVLFFKHMFEDSRPEVMSSIGIDLGSNEYNEIRATFAENKTAQPGTDDNGVVNLIVAINKFLELKVPNQSHIPQKHHDRLKELLAD